MEFEETNLSWLWKLYWTIWLSVETQVYWNFWSLVYKKNSTKIFGKNIVTLENFSKLEWNALENEKLREMDQKSLKIHVSWVNKKTEKVNLDT